VTGDLVGGELKDEREIGQRPRRQLLFVAGQKPGQVASRRSRGREALAIDTFHAKLAQSRSESPGETRSVRDGRKVAEFAPALVHRARGERLNTKPADRGEAGAGQALRRQAGGELNRRQAVDPVEGAGAVRDAAHEVVRRTAGWGERQDFRMTQQRLQVLRSRFEATVVRG